MSDSQSINKLYDLATGAIASNLATLAAKLKLNEKITNQPKSLEELSNELGYDYNAMLRLLRFLDGYGLVHLVNDKTVKASELTPYLDRLNSPHIIHTNQVMANIEKGLTQNKESWSLAFGQPFYPYLQDNPDEYAQFEKWCTISARDWLPSVFSMYDFSQTDSIIDIGAGEGYFLEQCLLNNLNQTGILFDLPNVIEKAKVRNKKANCESRIQYAGGNFFEYIPEGSFYVICRTLLNWNDEKALEILSQCYKSMKAGGKLVVIDFVIPDKSHPHYQRSLCSDFNLFALAGGSNRTEQQWKELIDKSHFKINNLIVSGHNTKPEPVMPLVMIECSK